jgi:hypothetical protein
MTLMAAHGEITPMPDAAIFADTQAEPASVYRWLDWLEKQLPFPVYRVTAGNLEADFLRALNDPNSRCGQPPFFNFNKDKGISLLWRKCTKEYKLEPIRRKVRELSGGKSVSQWIGISLDEAHRMKSSGVKYITNRYPLVDIRLTRGDCIEWMKKHGYPTPPRSACIFCPYTSDFRFVNLRDNSPDDWRRLVEFDHAVRAKQKKTINGAKITGTIYIHRSCVPIDQVKFQVGSEYGQLDMFGNECEGMCGV